MERKGKGLIILLGCLSILGFAGCVNAQTQDSQYQLPANFSWYGESGAMRAPVYDQTMPGLWWMPSKAPQDQENTQWGNRGYVFVGSEQPTPAPVITPVAVKAPEKVAEKVVYRDRVVENTKYIFLNLKDIYFAWDSADLMPLNLQILKDDAEVLKANPTVNVVLLGSASPEGGSTYNQNLSERRVNAVRDYLINKEGIAADRLKTHAEGAIAAEKDSWPFARKVRFTPTE